MKAVIAYCWAMGAVWAQGGACATTPVYTPCDLRFELTPEEVAAHRNPYRSVELRAEFNSPRHRTLLLFGFTAGERQLILRFTPTEEGTWAYRITSNLSRLNGQEGSVQAAASAVPGFVRVANVHHFATTNDNKAHLWTGVLAEPLGRADPAQLKSLSEELPKAGVNHVRTLVLAPGALNARGEPDVDYFTKLDEAVRVLHGAGVTSDLVIGARGNAFAQQVPLAADRERLLRYLIARYAPFSVTWQLLEQFETYQNGRALCKELGLVLKERDPYQHPRSTGAQTTGAPLLGDGWMNYIVYGSADAALGAVERQLYLAPTVNVGCRASEATSLWEIAVNGQYVACAPAAAPLPKAYTVAQQFFADTRHWELEPYFDVDGGRALAVGQLGEDFDAVEYILYIAKPNAPVEVTVQKKTYDVTWLNPATGETREDKRWKGERFAAEPPSADHPWVLHLSREGHKESLLKSYKFESRPFVPQVVEANSPKVPYEVLSPEGDELPAGKSVTYRVQIRPKRETRATRSMLYVWTGEATIDEQGYRVLGTGTDGSFTISQDLVRTLPGVLNLRVTALNANGKAYSVDKVYRIVP